MNAFRLGCQVPLYQSQQRMCHLFRRGDPVAVTGRVGRIHARPVRFFSCYLPASLKVAETPATVALAETAPVRVGTAVASARPLAFVSAEAGETVSPLPVKVTVDPATGLPCASLTRTVKGIGSRNPTDPVCPLPAEIA